MAWAIGPMRWEQQRTLVKIFHAFTVAKGRSPGPRRRLISELTWRCPSVRALRLIGVVTVPPSP